MMKRGSWKKYRWYGLLALLVILFLLGLWRWAFLARLLDSQQAAPRWMGDEGQSSAQVTCFFPLADGIGETDIYDFRGKAEQAFVDAGLEQPETGSLYIDAWSCVTRLNVSGDYGSLETAALGLGGDWFFFHPLALRCGCYLAGDDLMHDRVVLTEALAFDLFGAMDVDGMQVTIGGKPYYVAGVVSLENDPLTARLQLAPEMLFVYADTLSPAGTGSDSEAQARGEVGLTCYEMVMADPLDDFALNLAKENFPEAQVLQNSGRFSGAAIAGQLKHFALRSVADDGVLYPYWENAARLIESHLLLLVVLLCLAGAPPLTLALVLLWRYGRRLYLELKRRVQVWRER